MVPSCPPQALRLTTQTRSNNKTTLPRIFAGTSPPGDIHIIGMVGSRSPWKVEVSLLIFFCSVWAVGQSARRGGQFPTRYPRPIKPTRVNNNDKKIRINKGRRVPRAPTDVTPCVIISLLLCELWPLFTLHIIIAICINPTAGTIHHASATSFCIPLVTPPL